MLTILVAATLYTAAQGSAVQVKLAIEPRTRSVQVMWKDKSVPMFRAGDDWTTFLGVDLDTKPGAHAARALLTMEDGSVTRRAISIKVTEKKFPLTRLNVAPKFTELSKANLKRTSREAREVAAIYQRITTDLAPEEAFIVPIPGGSGRNFGERRVFNGQARAPHSGADLRAPTGTPVHATSRGRVVLAKDLFFTGNTVIVDHGFGIYSLYAHLSRLNVELGAVVEGNQVVGLAGATGRVTGPHLHWAIRMQGARVDPFSLVTPRAAVRNGRGQGDLRRPLAEILAEVESVADADSMPALRFAIRLRPLHPQRELAPWSTFENLAQL
jgi:murein DD-endopeptidase MepM/ murein hydrolase activator NlpD